jgi:O-antigen ligase
MVIRRQILESPGRAHPLDFSAISARTSIAELCAQFCVIALICIGILVPPINVTSSLWVRPEQVLLPLIFAVCLWLLLAGLARPIRWNGMFLVGALFCSSVLLSAWYGAEALHHTVILRDFYDLPKALFPVAFFTLAYEAELSEISLRRLLGFFSAAILLVCVYAWAQWMHFGFTQTLNAYYSALNHDSTLYYARRVYSTMGNPNHLGQLMSWSVVAFTLAVLFRVGNTFRNITLMLATLVTLVMTGSRYALLNGTVGVVLVFFFSLTSARLRKGHLRLLLVLLPILVLTFTVVAASNKLTLDRFKTVEHPLEVDSLRARLDRMWLAPWDDFVKSPLLGNGPAKSIYTGIITDSEYLDILKNFGILGFLPYIGYFLFPLYLMRKGLKAERHTQASIAETIPATLLTLRLGFIIGATALIMNTGMSTFNNLSLQSFIWIWLGLGARSAIMIRESANAGPALPLPFAAPATANSWMGRRAWPNQIP